MEYYSFPPKKKMNNKSSRIGRQKLLARSTRDMQVSSIFMRNFLGCLISPKLPLRHLLVGQCQKASYQWHLTIQSSEMTAQLDYPAGGKYILPVLAAENHTSTACSVGHDGKSFRKSNSAALGMEVLTLLRKRFQPRPSVTPEPYPKDRGLFPRM